MTRQDELQGGGTVALSSDISIITAEINAYQRVAGEAIFEIGRRLKHVKENDLAHGEWTGWCESELDMTPQYSNRFIRVFERFSDRNPGFSFNKVSLSTLNALVPLSDEQLEQEYELPNGEMKKPTEMSRRQIEELKKRNKETEELAEKAEYGRKQAELQADAERKERERLERENDKFRSKYAEGLHKADNKQREELYREFAQELGYIREKYSSIILDGDKVNEYAKIDSTYARNINDFNTFWNKYIKSVFEEITIIDVEVK